MYQICVYRILKTWPDLGKSPFYCKNTSGDQEHLHYNSDGTSLNSIGGEGSVYALWVSPSATFAKPLIEPGLIELI